MKLLKAVDLFCGAGGSTTGAENSGRVKVVLAVNHWTTAVQTHRRNHPATRHICARIDQVDPHEFHGFDVLMASPECTHHSNARGGRPVDDQKRATGWDVVRWAEACRPKWIVLENVREWLDWGPIGTNGRPLKSKRGETFKAFVAALQSLGYHVEWRLLNAADFGEATKRNRLFVIARRGGSGPIPWPAPTHSKETWKPAWQVIDWTRPCPSIFNRKRPLAEKTLRRIEIGIRKFCGPAAEPFVVKLRNNETVGSAHEPLNTITAGAGHYGLAQPFVVSYHGGRDPNRDGTERQHSLFEPLPTVDTEPRYALATPFLLQRQGFYDCRQDRAPRSLTDPVPTITANHGVGHLVMPFLTDVNHAGDEGRVHSVNGPLGTITTKRGKSLVQPFLVPNFGERDGQTPRTHSIEAPLPAVTGHGAGQLCIPFLTSYFANGKPQPITEPFSTLTAKARHGLALVQLMQEFGIQDIGFRMLDEDELARAQGFPDGYEFVGTKADAIRQIGNAVCPGVMRAICAAIGAA